jgi:hypothetical protein
MGSTKSVKLNPEVEVRIESVTLDEVRAVLEWGTILDDAIADEDEKYGKHWYSYLHCNLEQTLSRLTGTA